MYIIDYYYDKRYGKIVAAALRQDKRIFKGKTHAECFVQRPKGELVRAEQGFITERGKFVNRKLGLKIANHYNQVKYKHPPIDRLLSEDLI